MNDVSRSKPSQNIYEHQAFQAKKNKQLKIWYLIIDKSTIWYEKLLVD